MHNGYLKAIIVVLLVAFGAEAVLLWDAYDRAQPATITASTHQKADAAANRISSKALQTQLKNRFGTFDAVTFKPQLNLFQLRDGSRILYATADGKYLLKGSIYNAATFDNLTSRALDGMRSKVLAKIDPQNVITYSPKGETKHVVWAFVDVTCPYCRKLHQQIKAYTDRGIELRFLAFPRGGPGSKSWQLAQSVWCADNRKAALTKAYATQATVGSVDCTNPVAQEYQAGRAVGLRGTPMLMTSNGRVLGGYLSPAALVNKLKANS